jgi:curved DNA-binding protein CbpA
VATHYEVLGVEPDASPAALRAAYLAKARVLHPDRQVGRSRAEVASAQRRMQDVNAAWAVLGDPRARRSYDLSLRPRTAPASPRPASPRPAPRPARPAVVLEDEDDEVTGRALPFLVRVGPIVLLLGVLLTIFVVSAFAAGGGLVDTDSFRSGDEGTPEVGSCIDVRRVEPVDCEMPRAVPVVGVIEPGESCGESAVPIWWEEDEQLCVRPES